MSRFTDKLCPVCREKFKDNDDVVVCPECGTPHHRACYNDAGGCGVNGYHAEGFVWSGKLPDELETVREEYPRDRFDPHHADYPASTQVYPNNSDMPEIEDLKGIPEQYFEFYREIRSVTDDETRGEDGVSGKELCHFAGKSIVHYAQAFSAFRKGIIKNGKRQPVKIFFNICAGFFKPIHQFYRRMDFLGILLLMVSAITALPEILLMYDAEYASIEFSESMTSMLDMLAFLANIVSIGVTMLLCVFGDYLYYRFCVRRIKKIRSRYDDGKAQGYYMALTESGAPSKLRIIIGVLAYLLMVQLVARLPGQILL